MNTVSPITSSGKYQSQHRNLDIPYRHRLSNVFMEALKETAFADQWSCLADTTFRPYAAAALELSNIKWQSQAARQSLYNDLCVRKRIDVIANVVGHPVPAKVLKLLSRTDWLEFSRRDWKIFFSIIVNGNYYGLGHIPIITNTLVRQIEQIPKEIRLPALLNVMCNLEVPAERWIKLQSFINRADNSQLIEYRRLAGKISTKGDFWDFYFQCEGKHKSQFTIPATLTKSELLEPILTPQAMVSEGLKMQNCLASQISHVHIGNRIYFKMIDGCLVNAELVRSEQQWKPGNILGRHNSSVTSELENTIRAELSRLAKSTCAMSNLTEIGSIEVNIAQLRQEARNIFSSEEITQIADVLKSIQSKSISWSNGAYVILEKRLGGYVQFMSSPDGNEYLFEIASHKYVDYINGFLTADVVYMIEEAGFIWPFGKQNFKRWFCVSSQEYFVVMAETALAILARIFGLRNTDKLNIKSHIPE